VFRIDDESIAHEHRRRATSQRLGSLQRFRYRIRISLIMQPGFEDGL
jgi:hypothetical protein